MERHINATIYPHSVIRGETSSLACGFYDQSPLNLHISSSPLLPPFHECVSRQPVGVNILQLIPAGEKEARLRMALRKNLHRTLTESMF
jgi:hypothetical protein